MEYERSEQFYKSISEAESLEKSKEDSEQEIKTYETEFGNVEVKSKKFSPPESAEGEKPDPKRAIVFLPGYAVEANYDSVKELNEGYAKYGNQNVYSLSARTEQIDKSMPSINKLSSLHYQAEAMAKFIKEKGLTNVTLAGFSEGGEKAAELALIIQEEYPEINIKDNGLILLDSVGLVDQSASKLKRQFFKDAVLTPPGVKPIKAGLDIFFTALKEAKKSNIDFFKRIAQDTEAMAGLSTALEKLNMPIVLVQGEKDIVSNVNEIIPDKEARDTDREGYLKENIFKNSPYVRMIIGKRESRHGMPTYRSDEVTKTSLYMLDRYHRSQNSAEDDK